MLRELLAERQETLCARWLDAVLAEYGEVTAARWRQERDPFANPVGYALATGLPELVQAVIRGGDLSTAAVTALQDIVRIRSVQALSPSRAVGFVYRLRDVIRAEVVAELSGGAHAAELAALDACVESLALLAFDAYVALREQMFRMRQDELKRSVASILRRWHGANLPEGAESDLVDLAAPPSRPERR